MPLPIRRHNKSHQNGKEPVQLEAPLRISSQANLWKVRHLNGIMSLILSEVVPIDFNSDPLIMIVQSTQTLLTSIPETTTSEFEKAVEAASEAFKTWSHTSVITRQRFALEYVLRTACPSFSSVLQPSTSSFQAHRRHCKQHRVGAREDFCRFVGTNQRLYLFNLPNL
jgi:hypothetical protein